MPSPPSTSPAPNPLCCLERLLTKPAISPQPQGEIKAVSAAQCAERLPLQVNSSAAPRVPLHCQQDQDVEPCGVRPCVLEAVWFFYSQSNKALAPSWLGSLLCKRTRCPGSFLQNFTHCTFKSEVLQHQAASLLSPPAKHESPLLFDLSILSAGDSSVTPVTLGQTITQTDRAEIIGG